MSDVLNRLDELHQTSILSVEHKQTVEDAIDEIGRLRTRNELLEAALENQRRIGAGGVKGTST